MPGGRTIGVIEAVGHIAALLIPDLGGAGGGWLPTHEDPPTRATTDVLAINGAKVLLVVLPGTAWAGVCGPAT